MSDRDAEIALLKGLISIYSPTLHEGDVVDYCVKQMHQMGFASQIDEVGNAIGILGDGPNEIVLLGHIDTVPGFIEVRQSGDRLWGRGSVDAKGPLACFIAAGARVGLIAGWRITVVGAIGEEGDSHGAIHVCSKHQPKAAIIGEPSGWDHVTLGYKGSLPFTYTVKKAVAHSSAKELNANEIAIDFWNRLVLLANVYNEAKNRSFDQLSPTLKGMNTTTDGYYDTAVLRVGMRIPTILSIDMAKAMIADIKQQGDIEYGPSIPAFVAEKNTPLVRAFLASIRDQKGTPGFLLKTGTADMNIVGPAWQCPVLAYGPGDSSLDHTPDEHISISEFQASIDVLTAVLEKMCLHSS